MTVWHLVVVVLLTLLFALIGRALARRKNRRIWEWGLAAALFPPAILILLVLPKRPAAA